MEQAVESPIEEQYMKFSLDGYNADVEDNSTVIGRRVDEALYGAKMLDLTVESINSISIEGSVKDKSLAAMILFNARKSDGNFDYTPWREKLINKVSEELERR